MTAQQLRKLMETAKRTLVNTNTPDGLWFGALHLVSARPLPDVEGAEWVLADEYGRSFGVVVHGDLEFLTAGLAITLAEDLQYGWTAPDADGVSWLDSPDLGRSPGGRAHRTTPPPTPRYRPGPGKSRSAGPVLTKAVANQIADGVRYLNYATMGDAPGLEHPGDVYTLLGALHTATGRLPQLFGQLAGFMRAQAATGRLADHHHEDAARWARVVAADLDGLTTLCETLTRQLQSRQNDLAGMYVNEDDGG